MLSKMPASASKTGEVPAPVVSRVKAGLAICFQTPTLFASEHRPSQPCGVSPKIGGERQWRSTSKKRSVAGDGGANGEPVERQDTESLWPMAHDMFFLYRVFFLFLFVCFVFLLQQGTFRPHMK